MMGIGFGSRGSMLHSAGPRRLPGPLGTNGHTVRPWLPAPGPPRDASEPDAYEAGLTGVLARAGGAVGWGGVGVSGRGTARDPGTGWASSSFGSGNQQLEDAAQLQAPAICGASWAPVLILRWRPDDKARR